MDDEFPDRFLRVRNGNGIGDQVARLVKGRGSRLSVPSEETASKQAAPWRMYTLRSSTWLLYEKKTLCSLFSISVGSHSQGEALYFFSPFLVMTHACTK